MNMYRPHLNLDVYVSVSESKLRTREDEHISSGIPVILYLR
jgi:hypothetical protein